MNSRERILASLNKQPVDRIAHCEHYLDLPVVFKTAALLGNPPSEEIMKVMAQAGEIYSDDSLSAYEKTRSYFRQMNTLQPALSEMIKKDNIYFINPLLTFENFGFYLKNPNQAHLGFSADGIIKSRDDFKNIRFNNLDHLIEDAKEFLKTKGDYAACAELFLGIDPVIQSIGFDDFCCACIEDPDFVVEFLHIVSEHNAEVVEELCKLDFDFIWTFDDIAYHASTFFSPDFYRKYLLPETRKVADKINKSKKPWIFHSDGNLLPIWDDLISQGMNAIHPLEPGSMDLEYLRDNYKDKITFVGGVALTILESGTPEETVADTKRMLDIFKGKASYMLGTCNSCTENVKPENYKAMIETLIKYGKFD